MNIAEKFGSKAESRTLRSARVLASWHGAEGLISATSPLSPGIIDYFMCHKLTVNGTEREHHFACVRWFKKHPWNPTRIHSLFTGAYLTLDNVKLMAVCPIPRCATILPASY